MSRGVVLYLMLIRVKIEVQLLNKKFTWAGIKQKVVSSKAQQKIISACQQKDAITIDYMSGSSLITSCTKRRCCRKSEAPELMSKFYYIKLS